MPTKLKKTVPRSKLPSDPTLIKVQGALKQNVDFFLTNIGEIIKKYTESLAKATPQTVGAVMIKSNPESSGEVEGVEDKEAVYVTFPDNSYLVQQLQNIKKEAYELSTTYDGVYDWIVLNLPDLKEEDSTGLEVMNAVMEQISSLNEAVRAIYKLETKYFSERSEMEKAILKMPECKTLQLALMVNDEDTWVELGKAWRVMIRSCLILYTMLSKNMARLTDPTSKASAASRAYYQ